MNTISRKTAIDLGLPRYFTGLPCVRGHIALRQTISSACIECIKENHKAEKERYRRNRDKNRDA